MRTGSSATSMRRRSCRPLRGLEACGPDPLRSRSTRLEAGEADLVLARVELHEDDLTQVHGDHAVLGLDLVPAVSALHRLAEILVGLVGDADRDRLAPREPDLDA